MKICVIVYLLIFLFLFLLVPLLWKKEGFDDCIVGTLSDMKMQISELKTQVKKNSQELAELIPQEPPQESQPQELPAPTMGETEAYSKVSNMPEIMNSFGN